MSIRGLDERAIAALLEATVGHALDERAELVRVLGAQTAGNPFFIRELLAQLAESDERISAADTLRRRLRGPGGAAARDQAARRAAVRAGRARR